MLKLEIKSHCWYTKINKLGSIRVAMRMDGYKF